MREKVNQLYDSVLYNVKIQEDQGVSPSYLAKGTMSARIDDLRSIFDDAEKEEFDPSEADKYLRDFYISRAVFSGLQGSTEEKERYMEIASGLQEIIELKSTPQKK